MVKCLYRSVRVENGLVLECSTEFGSGFEIRGQGFTHQ